MYKASTLKFKVKNMIMLNVKFQITCRQNKILNFKNLGFYRIIRKIDNITYEFKLSKTIKDVFSVFHL